mmetsp:Transcript_7676/g.7076  ORF Transcript_7676/g.7076 Transcript_7676/m.7076 type:complete len:94 (+) Transcript_7676:2114-2395(+)
MTKTLSSFKSLMMKTMSQMSDHNMQKQYVQGQKQLQKNTDSVNVSSIHDDTYSVEISENLTRMISPKNLYNGQGSVGAGRNGRRSHENKGRMF